MDSMAITYIVASSSSHQGLCGHIHQLGQPH